MKQPKRDFGKNPVDTTLTPRCSVCKRTVPKHYLNLREVCFDCEEPRAIAMSRSVVNLAAIKSDIRRGKHNNGQVH
jgi:hypothetical protein